MGKKNRACGVQVLALLFINKGKYIFQMDQRHHVFYYGSECLLGTR
jgi:hypothetical protein